VRRIFLFLIFLNIFFLSPISYPLASHKIFAAGFSVDYSSEYVFSSTGEAQVTNQITLTNQQSGSYASQYVFQVKDLNLENLEAKSSAKILPITTEEKDNIKTVKISLDNNKTTGLDQKYSFSLSYKTSDLAKKQGPIWNINISNLPKDQSSGQIKIVVPLDFGQPQITSPIPQKLEQKDKQWLISYTFNNSQAVVSPRLAFGDFGLFSFELTYHLFNSNWQSEIQTIAIPPNILGYQEISINSLNPLPQKIETDPDGNILASYKLDYNEKKIIKLLGLARILPNTSLKSSQNQVNPEPYLLPAKYWETTSDTIINLLSGLSSNSDWPNLTNLQKAKKLYDFVTKNLSYDQQKANPRIERFGAVKAWENKDTALCMEYTDLLITLLRAADIPARELDGYAAGGVSPGSTNPSDILHTWVQIFDKDRSWFMVDPTWESTTGQDYFNSWDFNHLAFVVKGLDSEKPLPAGLYKITGAEKGDVKVEFATELNDKAVPLTKWISSYQEEEKQQQNSENLFGISAIFLILAVISGLAIFTVSRKKSHA